jgi:hypothetical protein
MKLVSYFQVNKQLRAERKLKKKFPPIENSPATPISPSKKNKSNENSQINNLKTTPNGQIPETAGSKLRYNHGVNTVKSNDIHHVQSCHSFNNQNNTKNHHDIEREKKEIEEEVLSYSPQPLVSYPDNLNLKGNFIIILNILFNS